MPPSRMGKRVRTIPMRITQRKRIARIFFPDVLEEAGQTDRTKACFNPSLGTIVLSIRYCCVVEIGCHGPWLGRCFRCLGEPKSCQLRKREVSSRKAEYSPYTNDQIQREIP